MAYNSLLAEDTSARVVARNVELTGYELYIVEQWACSREHLISLIATYTGLSEHKIVVDVISIPLSESEWTERLRTYVQDASKSYARRKETPIGTLMVTNLGGLPSTLAVIAVPNGDLRRHEETFILNENLKRMGCSGRAGLNLTQPTSATQAKFRQLYRISDRVPVHSAAVELVRLCQIGLVLFRELDREYTDGLLCDVTVSALKRWWAEIGMDYFNAEPNDGVLGPTTVSALLGLLLGARKRLGYCNAPIGKDVFDIRATKRGIEHFQKWSKMQKTRRLDRHTLYRLHRSTSKAVNSEGWGVPRAVKSTVAELGGKGGEMVMGMVGNRDRTSIASVETLDIQTFASAISGDSCKWLWHGKPRKMALRASPELFTSDDDDHVLSGEDFVESTNRPHRRDAAMLKNDSAVTFAQTESPEPNFSGSQLSLAPSDRDQLLRKTVLKSVTGRMNEARTGFGRFRDAVAMPSLRGQASRLSREEDAALRNEPLVRDSGEDKSTSALGNAGPEDHPWEGESTAGTENEPTTTSTAVSHVLTASTETSTSFPDLSHSAVSDGGSAEPRMRRESPMIAKQKSGPSIAEYSKPYTLKLFRSQSFDCTGVEHVGEGARAAWPRRSPSAEQLLDDRLSPCHMLTNARRSKAQDDCNLVKAEEQSRLVATLRFAQRNANIDKSYSTLLDGNSRHIERLDSDVRKEYEQVDNGYAQLLVDLDTSKQAITDCVLGPKAASADLIARIQGLVAKLDYEINGLDSKVEDVEDGLVEYEDQVFSLEEKTKPLALEDRVTESFLVKTLRLFTGTR